MNVEQSDVSATKKQLSFEVEADEMARETDGVVKNYRRKAKIHGFRPGKAPLDVIRRQYADQIEQDVRERVMVRVFREATAERGLEPIGEPEVEEVEHEEGSPLRFKTTFEVLPKIELREPKVEVRRAKADVGAEEVEQALEQLRQSRAKLVAEEGRSAETGDVVIADVAGTPEEGEPFTRENVPLNVGAADNLPDFNDAIAGVEAGTEKEFVVNYPKDFPSADLAGKSVTMRLAVHEVKRREIPELDDEFAKDLGDFDDLEALRARVREDLEGRKKAEVERDVQQSILDKILLENPVVLPEVLVEREVRGRLEEVARNMIMQGVDPEKADVDWVELRKRQEEPARKAVHARLVLDAIAKSESLRVEPREVDERIRAEATRIGESPKAVRDRLNKHGGVQTVTNQMLREKSLDYLTSIANIQPEE